MQGPEHTELARALRGGKLEELPVSDAERDLLGLVDTVTRHAWKVTDDQVAHLRDVGWRDEQIAEAVYVAALFNLFVRLADAFDIHPPLERELDGEIPGAVLTPR